METATKAEEVSAFLEAHYYDNGVRYLAFPQSQSRPAWAPASERAGIKNTDLRMKPGSVVVEYSRFATEQSEADWLGVFWPSGDQQLGNRGNYAGIGLWSQGHRYLNVHDLVDALGQISNQIAHSRGVPDKLASNILAFMKDYLPSHLEDDATLPEGIRPIQAAERGAKTKVEALTLTVGVQTKLPAEVCKSVAERVMVANLTRNPKDDYSRLLIIAAEDHASLRDGAISPISEVPDLTSHILKAIGVQGIETRKKVDQIARENAQLLQQIQGLEASVSEAKNNEASMLAELSDLREVNRSLEAEHALPPDLVRRLDRIEDRLPSTHVLIESIQKEFTLLESRIGKISQSRPAEIFKNPEIRRNPIRLTPQPEPTFWGDWGAMILGGVVLIIFLIISYVIYYLYF